MYQRNNVAWVRVLSRPLLPKWSKSNIYNKLPISPQDYYQTCVHSAFTSVSIFSFLNAYVCPALISEQADALQIISTFPNQPFISSSNLMHKILPRILKSPIYSTNIESLNYLISSNLSNFQRAKSFLTKCINCFRDKKTHKSFLRQKKVCSNHFCNKKVCVNHFCDKKSR